MQLISYFIITLFTELIATRIYCWKTSLTIPEKYSAIVIANLISFPLAWVLFIAMTNHLNWIMAFTITEIFVIVIEGLIIRPLSRLNTKVSFNLAAFINIMSASIGVLIWIFF